MSVSQLHHHGVTILRCSLMLVVVILMSAQVAGAQDAAPDQVLTTTTAPEFLFDANGRAMDTGGGFLYWRDFFGDGPAVAVADIVPTAATGYVQRYPLGGGKDVRIADLALEYRGFKASDVGVHYFNPALNGIVLQPLTNPTAATRLVITSQPSSPIVSDPITGMMYWISNETLFYADRDEPSDFNTSGYGDMADAGAGAHDLTLSPDGYLYWFGDDKIYRAYKFCTTPGSNCQREVVATASGHDLLYHQTPGVVAGSVYYLHWILGNTIQAYGCRPNLIQPGHDICTVGTIYADAAPQVGIAYLAASGARLFWIEADLTTENTDVFAPELKRLTYNVVGGAETIAGGQGAGATIRPRSGVAAGNGYVYFFAKQGGGPSKLARLRIDAPAIQPDMAISGMEVIQASQRLNNSTPLVARKETYVRVYGTLLSGPRRNGVDATLTASVFGQPFGSVSPINGVRSIVANTAPQRDLGDDSEFPRQYDGRQSWIFRLPPSWTTAGPLKVTATINPHKRNGEPNSANNIQTLDLNFADKAPICLVFIPVRTAAPVEMFGPAHAFSIDMVRRLLPASVVQVYVQANDLAELEARAGIPPWEYGPYELDEDKDKILLALWERDQLSDDPGECDDANARTHYIGVINPYENGGVNGSSWRGHDNVLYRLPPDNQIRDDWRAERGGTLAHELGHNYNRKHVDCPQGVPENVGNYPFTCDFDDPNAADPLYGFTYNREAGRFQAIAPTEAGDLMSYAHLLQPPKPRWISEVTWRDIFNELDNRTSVRQTATTATLVGATAVAMVTGTVDPTTDGGATLGYAWVLPSDSVSRRMLQKWEANAAPTLTAVRAAGATADDYHLRILDANDATLDDRLVELLDDTDSEDGPRPFALTFPAPAGSPSPVSHLELLHGETVIAQSQIGSQTPTVTLLQPAGGETATNQLTIVWRATDADAQDKLLFTVQYSPDNGATWRAILTSTDVPLTGDSYTMQLDDLSGLPASAGAARIRVLASDGFHTGSAISQPFTLADRPPKPIVVAPRSGQQFEAGDVILLEGMAVDSEAGDLPDSAFAWSIDGAPLGAGRQPEVGQLLPGEHTAMLTVTDGSGASDSMAVDFSVAPLRIPHLADPEMDGHCDDAVYENATAVQLEPYVLGGQATVFLLRSDNYLWACFADLIVSPDPNLATQAAVRVDVNHSRDSVLSDGDLLFVLGQDALPKSYMGALQPGPAAFDGQVSQEDGLWNAEMRISADVLGGWRRTVGLALSHSWVYVVGDDLQWPHSAIWDNPSTWATAAMGDLPHLTALDPDTVVAGSPGFTLVISGTELAGDVVAVWNGDARPTTVVDASHVNVAIGAEDLARAGEFRVEMAHNNGSFSNPLIFTVTNPEPVITQVQASATEVTVDGANFVEGATIQWDGITLPATRVSGSRLVAPLNVALLASGPRFDVAINNPGPGGGLSNIVTVAAGAGTVYQIYLPLVEK